MGTFTVPIRIAHPTGKKWVEANALADTGAFYTWLPGSTLAALGVKSVGEREFLIATGKKVKRALGEIRLRVNGEARTVLCVFGDEGSTPLLGAHSLEAFALAVDPVHKKLVPIPTLPAV
jgi:predicted aspartyl protease